MEPSMDKGTEASVRELVLCFHTQWHLTPWEEKALPWFLQVLTSRTSDGTVLGHRAFGR